MSGCNGSCSGLLGAQVALRCCRGAQHPSVGSQCLAQAKPTSWPPLTPSASSKLLNSPGQVFQVFFVEGNAEHPFPIPNLTCPSGPAGSGSKERTRGGHRIM